MLKKFWEDCKYIAKVASQDFQLVVAIKITIIPILVAVTSYAASYWPVLAIPKWTWIPVTIFTIVLCLLFIIARQMRMFETPTIEVFCDIQHKSAHEMKTVNTNVQEQHNLFLAIRNPSHRRVDGVKVKLITVWLSERVWQHPNMLLPVLNHEDTSEFSINPKDVEKVIIGKYWKCQGMSNYKLLDIEYTDFPSITFFIQLSSESLPIFNKKMILTDHTHGGFSFAEAKDN